LSEVLLKVKNLSKSFGGLRALDHIDLEIPSGQVVGLIGSNGSGKTTLINVLTGVYRIDTGNIEFDGREMQGESVRRRTILGLNRTFQIAGPFKSLTVRENVELAAKYGRGARSTEQSVADILARFDLLELADRVAGTLNGADQRRVDLARALATCPKLLFVDEIAAGLGDSDVRRLITLLKDIQKSGTTLLIVEHLLYFVRKLVDKVYVMDQGKIIFEGEFSAAVKNTQVRSAFLGE